MHLRPHLCCRHPARWDGVEGSSVENEGVPNYLYTNIWPVAVVPFLLGLPRFILTDPGREPAKHRQDHHGVYRLKGQKEGPLIRTPRYRTLI